MNDLIIHSFFAELEKIAEAKKYHGARKPLKSLRPGSYVTPYRRDALIFAVPWSSSELKDTGKKGGRPPRKLRFKKTPPKDHPIYLYEVAAPMKSALTNTGASYSWNRTTTGSAKLKLVKVIPSWQAKLLEKKAYAEHFPHGSADGYAYMAPEQMGYPMAEEPEKIERTRRWAEGR
jgi:hypothetical protein